MLWTPGLEPLSSIKPRAGITLVRTGWTVMRSSPYFPNSKIGSFV
jgi:hypothetical protein